MILTALTQYQADGAADTLAFGYAVKALGFTLVVHADGSGCRLQSNFGDDARAPARAVPNLARSGITPVPYLGCDTAAFVLGLGKSSEQPTKTQRKNDLFVEQVREFAASTADPVAAAYLTWIDSGKPGLTSAVESFEGGLRKRLDTDLVAIGVEGQARLLHEGQVAETFWGDRARAAKSSGADTLCLVCGRTRPTVSTLPQSLIGHLVPGASQANVALASVNFPAASRGASGIGLRSAPICADCASKAVQSFNSLAGSKDHAWRSPGSDTGLIWWTTNADFDLFAANAFQPDPQWVAALLRAPALGHSDVRDIGAEGRFFALTFSGNVARFVVRRFLQLPLGQLRANVVAWFRDVESPNRDRAFFPLTRYAACLGPMRREQGKWVTPPPEGAVEALVMVALARDRVPPHFLNLALSRAAAEVRLVDADDGLTAGLARRRMEARVGLLRLILNRSVLKENPMAAHVDEQRTDPAYLSGRLFAVSESLQRAALTDVNASIVDKYFQKALSNPASVVATLATLSTQHLKALERAGKKGAWAYYSREIRRLNALRQDAPSRLSAEQQAAWVCGYYQQRLHDIETAIAKSDAKKRTEGTSADSTPEA